MVKSRFISLEFPKKPDGEPIDDLSKRDKADPKTKSTEAAKARDEVQPGHLWGSFKLWNDGDLIEGIHVHSIVQFAFWPMVVVHHLQYFGCYVKLQLTVHSWFSKKYVHDGNVIFIGIVLQFILKKNSFNSILFVGFCNLRQGSYELFFTHRVWVLQSHRP